MAIIDLGNGGDTTEGTPDDDVINGGNGDDVIGGGDGDDVITGDNGNDVIDGGAGNDIISGGNGDDIIEGGAGDDTLTGGRSDDTFVFNFSVSGGASAQTYASYAAGLGITLEDGQLSQSQFSTSYTAWLSGLIGELGLGADTDGDGIISFGLNQNDGSASATPFIEGMTAAELDALFGARQDLTVNSGRTTQERFFSDLEASAATITAHDGTDVILDFRAQSMGEDFLQFNGIADAAQFAALFTVTKTDVGSDGIWDTVISWNGGSITLLGAEFENAQDLVDSGYLLLGG